MTTVTIEAGTLTASREDRVVTGLLLPYGEVGRTNLGRFSVDRGVFELPEDVSVLNANLAHDPTEPIARFLTATDTDAGIVTSFRIAAGEKGDTLLAQADDPNDRPALSVEVKGVVLRAGKAIKGKLCGAAFVKRGAFPSATLLAADAGDLPPDSKSESVSTETITVDGVEYTRKTTPVYQTETSPSPEDNESEDDDEEEDMGNSTASAPADLQAHARTKTRKDGKPGTMAELFQQMARAHSTRDGVLLAALQDITSADHTPNIEQPQYVGELWEGVGYERQYIPLFKHADLTAWTVNGWRWVTKPAVAKYAGNKTDVPSNSPVTEAVQIEAERIAGAHDIDRKYRDFNDVGFFESYYRAMTESYAEVSDVDVLDQVLAGLTPTAIGEVPTGVPLGVVAVVKGYLQVLRATRRRPTFALLSDELFEQMLYTPATAVTPYLEQMLGTPGGFDFGSFFKPSVDLEADQVLVGVKDAVTVHELGGGSPIRVTALDIAKGGEDHGVFGYTAVNVHREAGLALIDTDATNNG